ncbi:MAG: M20 family metallopeptidase [Sedimentibacter sp.]
MNKYYEKTVLINEELIHNRRTLHSYAEVGFDLPKTFQFVMEKLKSYGLEPRKSGKSGIVCTVGKEGKTILLRADMDALPMKEVTDLEFQATNGNCHSCGHDSHAAMLLGAAKLLKENEENLNGTVKFMFQPAEELLAGAKDMVDSGILENPKVHAAVGLHVMVGNDVSETGKVFYSRGTALFSGDAIRITVKGKNAHGSTPEKGIDAINIAAHIVIALQEIISREIPCQDNSVIIVGKISGGDTVNTLAGSAVLEVSVRATSEEKRAYLKNRIKEISESVAGTFRGEAIVEYWYGIGPLVNDIDLVDEITGYCKEMIGESNVKQVLPSSGSEDFTEIAVRVPAVMLYLGAGSIEEGHICTMHNPGMIVNEDVLPLGSALYAHCAESYLKNH